MLDSRWRGLQFLFTVFRYVRSFEVCPGRKRNTDGASINMGKYQVTNCLVQRFRLWLAGWRLAATLPQ